MKPQLEPGNYVVAVSGGVDSMVLLDLLHAQPNLDLVVAHYDHGIRPDSAIDRQLVQEAAAHYDLRFVYEEGNLGAVASEATARRKRYAFLERMRRDHGAKAVITAHHQDDLLETAVLNILRGTGRRGLTSLANRVQVVRPLLQYTKQEIIDYAQAQRLSWRDDQTNQEDRYLRNYIRHHVMPVLGQDGRRTLLGIIRRMQVVNADLDRQLVDLLTQVHEPRFSRVLFNQLPHAVAKELLAVWLRGQGVASFDAATLERVVVAAKVQRGGSLVDVIGGMKLAVESDKLALIGSER